MKIMTKGTHHAKDLISCIFIGFDSEKRTVGENWVKLSSRICSLESFEVNPHPGNKSRVGRSDTGRHDMHISMVISRNFAT